VEQELRQAGDANCHPLENSSVRAVSFFFFSWKGEQAFEDWVRAWLDGIAVHVPRKSELTRRKR